MYAIENEKYFETKKFWHIKSEFSSQETEIGLPNTLP